MGSIFIQLKGEESIPEKTVCVRVISTILVFKGPLVPRYFISHFTTLAVVNITQYIALQYFD